MALRALFQMLILTCFSQTINLGYFGSVKSLEQHNQELLGIFVLVGCSKISIIVIVKHVKHIGIIRVLSAWGNLISLLIFLVSRWTEKLCCALLGGVKTLADTITHGTFRNNVINSIQMTLNSKYRTSRKQRKNK